MNRRQVVMMLIGAATLTASGAYVFVYLYRWEWNRALISAAIFLAAEVAVLGWLLSRKLDTIAQDIDEMGRNLEALRMRRIAGHLDDARERPSTAFEWLRPAPDTTRVFIPVLLGAGLVFAALAWIVERVGRMTAGRMSDRHLAAGLSRLALPPGGLLDDRDDPLRDLRGPVGGRW